MRKILLSLLTIALVSLVAVGSSQAYFTSEMTVPNITMATGTIHIKDSAVDWMMTVNFGNLKPGDLIRKWVRVENDGTLDVETLTVSIINKNDPSNLLGHLRGWSYSNIMGLSDKQTGYNDDATILFNNAPLLIDGDLLHPGQWTNVQVQFVVPDLGEEWQGKTATFDLLFHAEQSHTGSAYF